MAFLYSSLLKLATALEFFMTAVMWRSRSGPTIYPCWLTLDNLSCTRSTFLAIVGYPGDHVSSTHCSSSPRATESCLWMASLASYTHTHTHTLSYAILCELFVIKITKQGYYSIMKCWEKTTTSEWCIHGKTCSAVSTCPSPSLTSVPPYLRTIWLALDIRLHSARKFREQSFHSTQRFKQQSLLLLVQQLLQTTNKIMTISYNRVNCPNVSYPNTSVSQTPIIPIVARANIKKKEVWLHPPINTPQSVRKLTFYNICMPHASVSCSYLLSLINQCQHHFHCISITLQITRSIEMM